MACVPRADPETAVFRLRGFCSVGSAGSSPNTAYTMAVSKSGEIYFRGMTGSTPLNIFTNYEVARDSVDGRWTLSRVTEHGREGLAHTRLADIALPLAIADWTYNMSSVDCAKDGHSQAQLSLNNCPPGKFGCYTFAEDCLDSAMRCDEAADCMNGFDEKNCNMVRTNENYYSHQHPPPLGCGEKAKAGLSVNILVFVRDIVEIDEDMQKFKVTFDVALKWLDKRLSYRNLKDKKRNMLTAEDMAKIWKPLLYYNKNTGTNQITAPLDQSFDTYFFIERKGNSTVDDETLVREEVFKGEENVIIK